MAVVILKNEPRYVSGRLLKPGARCTVPDSLARAMETRGLCDVVVYENRLERQIEIKAPAEPPAEPPAPKKPIKRAAKKKEQE